MCQCPQLEFANARNGTDTTTEIKGTALVALLLHLRSQRREFKCNLLFEGMQHGYLQFNVTPTLGQRSERMTINPQTLVCMCDSGMLVALGEQTVLW